jgi:hypothetical protein
MFLQKLMSLVARKNFRLEQAYQKPESNINRP